MPTTRYRYANMIMVMQLLILTLTVCLSATVALAQSTLKAKAQTITANGLLNAPPSEAGQFAVAKTAPKVEFVEIPLPETPANPWSIWGYSLIHSNGKVYIPLGDHLGIDSNSYLYEYDPATSVIRQVADVLSSVESYQKGDFGYGKIHGRLNEGANGDIYFGTYWGQWNKMPDNKHYHGDRVFRFNPETEKLTDLGMPKFGWGFPSTNMDEQRLLFYAEAHKRKSNAKGNPENNYVADGYETVRDTYQVEFLVYDTESRKVVFQGGHEGLSYGRDFFVDDEGNAYFNNGDGSLQKYDPEKNDVEPVEGVRMPAEGIRRAFGPDNNGVLYGSTHENPSKIFSFDPGAKKIRTIATTSANTAGADVEPSGKYIYYVPGAHGPHGGVPLVQVDTASGKQKVIVYLREPVWEQTHYNLGGTYSVHVSDDGSKVYIAINGKKDDRKKAWAHLAFLTVHIPKSER